MYCKIYFIVNFALVIRVLGDHESGPDFRSFNVNNANILHYPYLVSIELGGKHNCGGSLIRANLVLTAAHCIVFEGKEIPPEVLLVRAGITIKEQDRQTAKVIEYCVHPKYEVNNVQMLNDEAVMKLDHSLTLNFRTQLIELQPKGLDVPDNSIGTLTGWGAVELKFDESIELTLTLQEIRLFKINQEVCRVISLRPISDSATCFGSGIGSNGACLGDSGGPLVVDGRQVGIVSHISVACGLPLFFPNVFTRVEHEDIRSHIDQCISKLEK